MPLDCSSERWIMRQMLTWKEVKALHQLLGDTRKCPYLGNFPCLCGSCLTWLVFPAAPHLALRMTLSQLFGSSTAAHVVCGGVAKICTVRFLLCRDLLILQQLLLRLGDPVSTAPGAPGAWECWWCRAELCLFPQGCWNSPRLGQVLLSPPAAFVFLSKAA